MENNVKLADKNSGANIYPRISDEVVATAKEMGNEYWDRAKTKGQKTLNQAKGFIQKNPGKTVGYAVLLGVVVAAALLINSRSKN